MAKHRRQRGSQPPDDNCCSEWGTVSFKRTVSLTEIGALEKQRILHLHSTDHRTEAGSHSPKAGLWLFPISAAP
jgi:hypothetical protein